MQQKKEKKSLKIYPHSYNKLTKLPTSPTIVEAILDYPAPFFIPYHFKKINHALVIFNVSEQFKKFPCNYLTGNCCNKLTKLPTSPTISMSIPETIDVDLEASFQNEYKGPPIFWDGKTAERTLEVIKTALSER